MGVSVSSRHSTATTATSSEPPWKKYRPSRAPHRLTHVLSERNIAPARSKWAKYCTFRRAGAKNISRHPTTPHAGAVFLSPQLHPDPQAGHNSPCSAQRTRAKQFAQRPLFLLRCAKKFALQAQTGEKRCFQACWASFFAEMSLEGPCRASFFAPWDWQLGPSTGTPADARLNPIGGVVGSLPAQSPTGLTRAGCVHRSRS